MFHVPIVVSMVLTVSDAQQLQSSLVPNPTEDAVVLSDTTQLQEFTQLVVQDALRARLVLLMEAALLAQRMPLSSTMVSLVHASALPVLTRHQMPKLLAFIAMLLAQHAMVQMLTNVSHAQLTPFSLLVHVFTATLPVSTAME